MSDSGTVEKLMFALLGGAGVAAMTFICLYLRRIVQASDENKASIDSISANMAKIYNQLLADFVMKREFDPVRDKVNRLENDVTELQVVTGIKDHPRAKQRT